MILLKEDYCKEIRSYFWTFQHFRTHCFERIVLFLQMNGRVFLVCKMAYHVSFKTIETHLHKNIYPSHVMGDKGKKASFRKASKPFSTLHWQLTYSNTGLVISSTERQHTIGSKARKGLGHDSKAKAMASYCRRDSTIQKISNRFFWHNVKGDVEEFINKCYQCRKQGKLKKYQVNLIAFLLKLR